MNEIEAREDIMVKVDSLNIFLELNEFLADPDIEKGLNRAIAIVAKPIIPKEKAAILVIQFQAISVLCKARSLNYIYVLGAKAGSDNYKKKSIYQTMAKEFHEMAQSMKYLVNA